MTRVNGRRPEPQKVEFINDWSKLKEALATLNKGLTWLNPEYDVEAVGVVLHYVPALLDAYSELWELAGNLMRAVEAQQENQQTLYVPDAQEMVQGLANTERTRR